MLGWLKNKWSFFYVYALMFLISAEEISFHMHMLLPKPQKGEQEMTIIRSKTISPPGLRLCALSPQNQKETIIWYVHLPDALFG